MFTVEIDGVKHEARVSFLTVQLYETEFGADMLKELFGKQGDGNDPIVWDGDTIEAIDFTKVNWSVVMKVLWAALKTEDASLPGYSTWAKDVTGVNMWEVRMLVDEAVNDCFFRASASEPEEEAGE